MKASKPGHKFYFGHSQFSFSDKRNYLSSVGDLVEIEGEQFHSGGGVVELTFENGDVKAGAAKVTVASCNVDTSPLSTVVSVSGKKYFYTTKLLCSDFR